MAPITRFAAFKYKPGTTDVQKRQVLDIIVKLYEENARMINYEPFGGRNINPRGLDKGFDIGFTVEFKSKEYRDEFDADEKHAQYIKTLGDVWEDVFIYDSEKGDYGY